MTARRMRIAAVGLAVIAGAALAVARAGAQQQDFDKIELDVQRVSGNVHMIVGAGGNTTVFTGPEGGRGVDTSFGPMSGKLLDAVRKLAGQRIRRGGNTRVHAVTLG